MTHSDLMAPVEEKLASDQTAIASMKRGDVKGLATLVENYQVKAVHAALLIVHDRYLAEDIVQEAFLQVYRKIELFDDRRPFGPWFLRIVINAAIKSVDREKRSMPLEETEDGHFDVAWLIDPGRSPEMLMETAEMRESIWRALDYLTPDQRAAVVLRYFLDRNESEMIQDLNRPLTTIKWWLYAARVRLRKLLQPVIMSEHEHKAVDDQVIVTKEIENE